MKNEKSKFEKIMAVKSHDGLTSNWPDFGGYKLPKPSVMKFFTDDRNGITYGEFENINSARDFAKKNDLVIRCYQPTQNEKDADLAQKRIDRRYYGNNVS